MLTTSAWRWWSTIPAAWFMLNPLQKLGKLIWNIKKIESFYALMWKCKLHLFLQVRSSWLRDQLLQPAEPGGRGEVTGSVRVDRVILYQLHCQDLSRPRLRGDNLGQGVHAVLHAGLRQILNCNRISTLHIINWILINCQLKVINCFPSKFPVET